MDDNNFDRFIKDKLDGYEDPSFDPSALEGFHDKLSGYQLKPWYRTDRMYYLAASAAFLAFFFAYYYQHDPAKLVTETNQTRADKNIIDSLTSVIRNLRAETNQVKTTRDSSLKIINGLMSGSAVPGQSNIHIWNKNAIISLGPVVGLPKEIYDVLMAKGMLVEDNGEVFLTSPDKLHIADHAIDEIRIGDVYHSPVISVSPMDLPKASEGETSFDSPKNSHQQVSSKIRKALEKHYSKGVGIFVGSHADFTNGIFSDGDGLPAARVGLMADWVLSPSFSVETGIDYSTTSVRFDDGANGISVPGSDPALGRIEDLRIKNSLLSVPVSIKYRKWLSDKVQAFARVGYTPYFSFHQEFQCGYDFDNIKNGSAYGTPNEHRFKSIVETNDHYLYAGTGTTAVGLTKQVGNRNKIEGSLFYEKSFSNVGKESLGMQILGLRAAFWFNIR